MLAARGFLGMVIYHFLVQELFGGEKYQNFDAGQVAQTLAAIWLAGMQSTQEGMNGANGNGHQPGSKKKTAK